MREGIRRKKEAEADENPLQRTDKSKFGIYR